MIALPPLVPRVDENDAFFSKVLFVYIFENCFQPRLIRPRTGMLPNLRVILPSGSVIPRGHHAPETHVIGDVEMKILQKNFRVIVHHAFKIRVQKWRRLY